MKALKLFGGIFGPAIVLPATAFTVAVFFISAAFDRKSTGLDIGLILSFITLIGTFGVPAITVMNFVKADNEFRKLTAVIVILVGAISSVSVFLVLLKDFGPLQLVVLIAALLIFASGILQLANKR